MITLELRRLPAGTRSGALLGVAYDPTAATLYVRYRASRGTLYVHPGVTSHQWAALRSSKSLGRTLRTVAGKRPAARALRVG